MRKTPTSEEDLSDLIQSATGPIRIVGGGTRDIGAPVDGTLVSTAGLSGVTLYESGALTLVAQSGTPLAEIDALLAKEGQRLAFELQICVGCWAPKGCRPSAALWPPTRQARVAFKSGPRGISAWVCALSTALGAC